MDLLIIALTFVCVIEARGFQRKPCSFFLEGNCRRSDCKFAHDISNITCRFWEEGGCFKGPLCPFLHGYRRGTEQTDEQRGHIRTSSMSKTQLSDKQTCLYRQRSLSESDADSEEQTKSSYEWSATADKNVSEDKTSETKPGHKQKVSSVVKTDDYEDSTGYKVDSFSVVTDVANNEEPIENSATLFDASNTRQTETNGYTSNPSGKRIYLPNLHSKLIKFLIEFPDRRRHLEDDIAGKGFGIVWTQTEEGIPFLESSGRGDSCTRISSARTEDGIAAIFYDRLRHYFVMDDSICAAEEICEDLTAHLSMSPLVTNCTIYNENRNWVIIGDKQSVEDCKCQLMALIQFLEMRLKASGTNKVTKTKFLIKERVCIILESKKLDKFRGHNDTLKVDFAEDFEHIKFYGDMQAIESVMQELHTYLQTVQGSVYNCSRLIRRWLNNIKGTSNLKELLRSHGLVSSWRIEEDTCFVYGSSLEDVRSVKKIFDRVLVSEILKLSDAQNELMHSEIGRAEIIDETKRYEGFLEIKIADHEVEIACLLQIEEVRSRLREFLIQHEVIKTAQKVDNGLFKLLQQYHYDKLALMQQRCKTILVEVNTFEERAKCGFVLTGRREVCMKAVRELENLLATIPSFKLTIKGVGLASFLQSEEGRDQIATFESKHRCIVNFANGIPDSQDEVRDCQYDDNRPLVLNDEIGLAGQISVKETRSRVDGSTDAAVLHVAVTSSPVSADPAVLAVTSPKEGKRQSYIHELINTEETYMEDMSVVMDAFYKPFQSSGALTEEQLQSIFVNWQELMICNMKFLEALQDRKKLCGKDQAINMIGDIICENIPYFKPYIQFCTCQSNANALLQRLIENSPQLRELHKKCITDPKAKSMPLSSFLIKPMQRITKYPLILENILKYTSESHPDHKQLLDAQKHTKELCSQVNEGVREKENSDRLEWIQQHVLCDGLAEKITFNSVTNFLGPRKLLQSGVLIESKSDKEFDAFLFNDFLLLTTSDGPLSTQWFFDVTENVQYKMYKTPMFLNEVMVKKPEEEKNDVFHLSHIDGVYNLRCHSQYDRDTWVRKLETASRHYLDTERKNGDVAMRSTNEERTYRLSATKSIVNVEVSQGDITKETTDAIVNSVFWNLDLSATVLGKAVLDAGGSDIQTELRTEQNLSAIRREGIVVTGTGKLNSTYVFHVTLQGSVKGLKTAISSCLKLAETRGVTSLSFPALGTGRDGIQPQDFTKIILKSIKKFSTTNPQSLRDVRIVIYDEAMFHAVLQTPNAFRGRKATTEKTVTYRPSSDELMVNVEVLQGDITKETTDAIVNSVHWHLDLSATFLGKALLKVGGSDIQTDLKTKENRSSIHREGIEGIIVTGPGKLNCKYIFHVMLQDSVKGWKTVISNCLQLAETRGVTSLSFPALGTGRNGIKPQDFAKAILKCTRNLSTINTKSLREVRIVTFDEAMFFTVLQTANDFKERKAKIYHVRKSTRQLADEVRFQVYTAGDNVDQVKRNLDDLFKKETAEG